MARGVRSGATPGWTGRCASTGCCFSTSAARAGPPPLNRHTLAALGSPQAQADYLAHFRADSIAADAELIRRQLTGGQPWSVLGQSFGGFCAVSYLSQAPEGIREAFITGGLPGLRTTPTSCTARPIPSSRRRTRAHYERYPADMQRAREIGKRLAASPAMLPGGGLLTVEAFQALGGMLGSSRGSHGLHYLLEDPFAGTEWSDHFLQQVQSLPNLFSPPAALCAAARCVLRAGHCHPLGRPVVGASSRSSTRAPPGR